MSDSGTLIDLNLNDSDRSIWCWNYNVSYTYDGFMVRTPSEDCNELMLESTKEYAKKHYGNWPIKIIEPNREEGQIDYPKVKVTAFFTSTPMDDEMHLSSMILVWFQNEVSPIPDEINKLKIQNLDWCSLAEDYET